MLQVDYMYVTCRNTCIETFVLGLSINDEAVNYAFAGDHVNVTITGVDITNIGVGKYIKSWICMCVAVSIKSFLFA